MASCAYAQQVDLTKQSVAEIKAMIYDQMVSLTNIQKNIQILEGELQKRQVPPETQVEVKPPATVEEEKK